MFQGHRDEKKDISHRKHKILENYHRLSGQRIQDHSKNGTGLDTSHEIKPLLSQNHTDPSVFLVGIHPDTLLAQHSQSLFEPWTITSVLTVWQTQVEDHLIQGQFKETSQCLSWYLNTYKV